MLVCIGVVDVDVDALDMKRLALLAAVAAGLMVTPAAGAQSGLGGLGAGGIASKQEQQGAGGLEMPTDDAPTSSTVRVGCRD